MNVNDIATAEIIVNETDTAKAISISEKDDFPAVFATAKMIALMELASARNMQTELKKGQLSVGVGVDIKHLAPTPVGCKVQAKATFLGMANKLFEFKVEVFDDSGLVGTGTHTRAIVNTERLVAGAEARKKP